MKSVIKSNQEIKKEKSFPKLMQSKESGNVILFTEKEKGILVFEGDTYYGLGHFSKSWNMDNFIDFEGNIILSNND